MRTRSAGSLVLSLFLLVPMAAAPPAGAADPLDKAMGEVRAEAIRAHVRFLADDLLEGRGTGTRGHELAAKYVAGHFEAMGLEPAGTGGTYFQPVPLRRIELVAEQSTVGFRRGDAEETLRFGEDFVMGGHEAQEESSVEAPVVFVGFGTTAPEFQHDDYAGVDVRGKIVAYLDGAPARFPTTERAYYSSAEVKLANAAARGAVGILRLRTPEDEKRQPWPWVVRQARSARMRWLDEQGNPNDARPEIRGVVRLGPSGAEKLFRGATKALDAVFAAAAAGEPQAFALPATAEIRTVSRHGSLESPNVVALLRGSDARLRDEYVVFTAHLDHLGIGEPVNGDAIYNGAVDNASGSAILLEVARAFASLPQRPKRSLLFVAVTGEERGLLGSDYFAHAPPVPLDKIVADINLDVAPILYQFRDVVPLGAEHSSLGKVVAEAAGRLKLELSPDPLPEETLFIRSDQFSFVRKGIPSVFLIPGGKASDPQLDGSALFMKWLRTLYHTPKDDLGQGFDYQGGVQFVQLNLLIGYHVAQQAQRPRWNPGDFFEAKFGGGRGQ